MTTLPPNATGEMAFLMFGGNHKAQPCIVLTRPNGLYDLPRTGRLNATALNAPEEWGAAWANACLAGGLNFEPEQFERVRDILRRERIRGVDMPPVVRVMRLNTWLEMGTLHEGSTVLLPTDKIRRSMEQGKWAEKARRTLNINEAELATRTLLEHAVHVHSLSFEGLDDEDRN